jgi:hypothetical protein
MPPSENAAAAPDRFRQIALWALLAAFAWRNLDFLDVLKVQPLGVDYAPFRAGMQALAQGRAYDFTYVTDLQGWPMGPEHLRPFLYPPSSFPLFSMLAALPYWVGYGLLVAGGYALFAWAGRRIGAPWWMLAFPAAGLVAICGQVTFLVGGLLVGAISLERRPLVAGVLFGLAAALKPQLLVLAPLALLGARQWRTLAAAGVTVTVAVAASALIWGLEPWFQWVAAMPRFQAEVMPHNPGLLSDAITPYAMLAAHGLPGAWSLALAPVAIALAWFSLDRRLEFADRLVLLTSATLMILSYAMHYEAALLLPAVAAYLSRTEDRLWPLYAAAACVFAVGLIFGFAPVAAALTLPLSTWLRRTLPAAYARRATAKSARSCSAGRQLLEP